MCCLAHIYMRSTALKAIQAAEDLKNSGVEVITIGVGDVNQFDLEDMASRPELSFYSIDFVHLPDITDKVATKTCAEALNRKSTSTLNRYRITVMLVMYKYVCLCVYVCVCVCLCV